MNLSVALGTLDVLATVLREAETPVLESSDLLAVLQLLKQVSDVEAQEGEELEMLEQLGQYYVEVTELILEEQNIETWSSVSQVTVSPAVWVLCATSLHLLCVQLLGLLYDPRLRTCPRMVTSSLSGHILELVEMLQAWAWSHFGKGQLLYCCLICWRCKQVLLQTSAVKWCLSCKPLQWLSQLSSSFSTLSAWIYRTTHSLQIPGAL